MRRIAVGDIMTRNVVSVKPETNLFECAKVCVKNRINTLLVAENAKLKGILTTRDLLWAITKSQNQDIKKIRAIDIAKRKVAVIKPSADIVQALQKMKAVNFRRLPVLSRGELVGVVSLKDILRISPDLYHEIGELSDIREENQKLESLKPTQPYPVEGFCENCGAFSDLLKVENKYLCQDCRDELY